MHGATFKARMN